MICIQTVDAEIKPWSALAESWGCWEPGRKRHGNWTAEGKVNGAERPVSGPYACVKGRKCDGISARADESRLSLIYQQRWYRKAVDHALSFGKDRAVFL